MKLIGLTKGDTILVELNLADARNLSVLADYLANLPSEIPATDKIDKQRTKSENRKRRQ